MGFSYTLSKLVHDAATYLVWESKMWFLPAFQELNPSKCCVQYLHFPVHGGLVLDIDSCFGSRGQIGLISAFNPAKSV